MTDTTTLAPTDLCRSEFEAWHIAEVRKLFPVEGWVDAEIIEGTAGPRGDGSYRAAGMQRSWEAWQAAWNRRAPTLAPTDAEIEALRDAFDWDGWTCPKAAQRAFARAVLAKWGAPATASGEAMSPFGYFRAEPFGWTDCAESDEGAKPLYESPPPAQEVRVPLSDDQIDAIRFTWTKLPQAPTGRDDFVNIVRLIESHHGITAAQKAAP